MISSVVLVLLAASDINLLDVYETEYVSADYELISCTEIDPLDYIEPQSYSRLGPNCSAQVFFMDTAEGEKWRVIIVGSDRVAVIDEGEDAWAIDLPDDGFGAVYSSNGEYLIVTVGNDINTRMYAWIDIENRELRTFDLIPDIPRYYIGNDGAVRGYGEGELCLFTETLDQYEGYPVDVGELNSIRFSPSGNMIVGQHTYASNPGENCYLVAYSTRGELLWTYDMLLEFSSHLPPVFTEDGECILVFLQHGIRCISAETGELEWIDTPLDSGMIGFWQISDNRCYWAMSSVYYSGEATATDQNISLRTIGENGRLVFEVPGYSEDWTKAFVQHVSDNGYVLAKLRLRDRTLSRAVLLNPDGSVAWASAAIHYPPHLRTDTYNYNHDRLGGSPCRLSSNGTTIIYSDDEYIRIVELSENTE